MYAPDGIEKYEDARRRAVEMEGFPLCSMDDVIESKRQSNRAKDRESLPRLEDFARYLKREQPAEIKRLAPRRKATLPGENDSVPPPAKGPTPAAGSAGARRAPGLQRTDR